MKLIKGDIIHEPYNKEIAIIRTLLFSGSKFYLATALEVFTIINLKDSKLMDEIHNK